MIDEVSGTHERVTITENGSPVAVLLAVEDYESLMETIETLSDPEARSAIRQAETEMAGGEVYDETQLAEMRLDSGERLRRHDLNPGHQPRSVKKVPGGAVRSGED